MFYSLKGILTHVEPSFFVVECGGVGYKCYTTLTTQRSLPKMGQEIKVYTYMFGKMQWTFMGLQL